MRPLPQGKSYNPRITETTGKPAELSSEERRLLTEKAKGIDPETLKNLSVLDPKDRNFSDLDADSTEKL